MVRQSGSTQEGPGHVKSHSSPMCGSLGESATRGLRCSFCLVACSLVLLAALWPAGDPGPRPTAMVLAAGRGNVAAIDELLRGGVDVDYRDEYGVTPLMAAARAGQLGAVRTLLAAGARIDACGPQCGTPLMCAALFGHHEVLHVLIDGGAQVD